MKRRSFCAGALALPGALLAGCASGHAAPAIPADLVDAAVLPGLPGVRQWGDVAGARNSDLWLAGPEAPAAATAQRPLCVLAISGGGANGAFAAGLITGWTKTGTRPECDIVTGVSAGALVAPFAFLGPAFDDRLRELFVGRTGDDIVAPRQAWLAIFRESLASAEPLRRLIASYVDVPLLHAIAREHRRGRRLLVGTTHIYAGRLMVWSLGAIAASGRPEALELIRRVLLASASMPILLPPVYVEVEAGGRRYSEMHADGSMTRQVFVAPPGLDWSAVIAAHRHRGRPEFYVIRNGRAKSEYMQMAPRLTALGEHALHLLAQSQGIGDLYTIYVQALQAGAAFRAAWIGDEFDAPWTQWYDAQYVQALFDYGERQAAGREVWRPEPPGMAAPVFRASAARPR